MAATDLSLRGWLSHSERNFGDYREVGSLPCPHAFAYQGQETVRTSSVETVELKLPLDGDRFRLLGRAGWSSAASGSRCSSSRATVPS